MLNPWTGVWKVMPHLDMDMKETESLVASLVPDATSEVGFKVVVMWYQSVERFTYLTRSWILDPCSGLWQDLDVMKKKPIYRWASKLFPWRDVYRLTGEAGEFGEQKWRPRGVGGVLHSPRNFRSICKDRTSEGHLVCVELSRAGKCAFNVWIHQTDWAHWKLYVLDLSVPFSHVSMFGNVKADVVGEHVLVVLDDLKQKNLAIVAQPCLALHVADKSWQVIYLHSHNWKPVPHGEFVDTTPHVEWRKSMSQLP